jgi:hypothetical protein
MPNKIIWFLLGNPTHLASSRIHGLAIHAKLIQLGYNSLLAYTPAYAEEDIPITNSNKDSFATMIEPGDIVILQKVKKTSNLDIIDHFTKIGLHVVLVDCDAPIEIEIGKIVDQVVCASKTLAIKYHGIAKQATYIEDAPELYVSNQKKTDHKKLKCYWFGYSWGDRWNEVLLLKKILEDARLSNWELITISNHPDATMQWRSDSLKTISEEADVVAIPIFTISEWSTCKSANRLLQSMALSLPVVCSPLPSYQDIASTTKGILVCQTQEEWVDAFIKLEDKKLREEMGVAAFDTAKKFNLDHSIFQWIDVLRLNQNFKISHLTKHRKEQRQMNALFYAQLMKKNILYYIKAPFSIHSIVSAGQYLQSKIRSVF